MSTNDIGAIPLSRDIGALQSVSAVGTTLTPTSDTIDIAGSAAPNVNNDQELHTTLGLLGGFTGQSVSLGFGIQVAPPSSGVTISGLSLTVTASSPVTPIDVTQALSTLWRQYLTNRGYGGGTMNDMLLQAFTTEASLVGQESLTDAVHAYFDLVSVPTGSTRDRMLSFLDTNYPTLTGSVTDRLVQTLRNNEFFL